MKIIDNNMELQEFIKNSLVNIRKGVSDANDDLMKDVNKHRVFELDSNSKEGGHVDFDIAVIATSEKGKTGGGGIKIAVVSVGGEVKNKKSEESVSRIKFSVKIGWTVN